MIQQNELRKIRLDMGLSQLKMAEIFEVSTRMYQYYEYGEKLMPKYRLEYFCYKHLSDKQ